MLVFLFWKNIKHFWYFYKMWWNFNFKGLENILDVFKKWERISALWEHKIVWYFLYCGPKFLFWENKKKVHGLLFYRKKKITYFYLREYRKFFIIFIKWDRSVSFPILKLLNNNRFKTSVPKLNYNYILSGGSYSISDIKVILSISLKSMMHHYLT